MMTLRARRMIALAGLVMLVGIGADAASPLTTDHLIGYGSDSQFGLDNKPDTCWVRNLRDEGFGSLRSCIDNRRERKGAIRPRIIRFRKAGVITLRKDIEVRHPYLVIDGLSAPPPGITITKRGNGEEGQFLVTTWRKFNTCAHDILIQGLRFRGVWNRDTEEHKQRADTFSIDGEDMPGCVRNIVIHRVTALDAQDSSGTIWGSVSDVTIGYSAFIYSLHPQSHAHWPGGKPHQQRQRISIHHNLFAFNHERQTNIRGNVWDYDYIANVVYAWDPFGFPGGNGLRLRCRGGGCPRSLNIIGNHFLTSRFTPPGSFAQALVLDPLVPTRELYFANNRFPIEVQLPPATAPSGFIRPAHAQVPPALDREDLALIGVPHRSQEEEAVFESVRLALEPNN